MTSNSVIFDPFQVFEVTHKHCATLNIRVLCGRRITKGWAGDLVDTPDPYIILTVSNSPQPWRKTTVKDNDVSPQWNETFTFWLDPEQEHSLEMSLMDSNYTVDEHLATRTLSLSPLPINRRYTTTVQFNESSEIDFEIWAEINENTDLRYSLMLCREEKQFIETRKRVIWKAMKSHYGFASPRNYKEVPVVAVIGSGGGFRAMCSYSGVISALSKLGVLDMTTYVGGLSGSAWYLSQLYSHHEWPLIEPAEQREEIKHNIDHSFMWLFKTHGVHFVKEVWKKRNRGEPVSFTDLFGHLVGNTLMKDRLDTKLSDQRQKISAGQIPMPLYTCLHVKKSISAMIFHEWMEFTPYEIGLPKYGTFLKAEHFGCKFFMGVAVRRFPEPPLHFLQGIWGSAFCIQFKRLLQDDKSIDSKTPPRDEREEFEEELKRDMSVYDKDMADSESSGDEEPDSRAHVQKGGIQKKRSNSTKMKQQSFWDSMVTKIMESKWFQSIELRAAQVFNFMRGLSLNNMYPVSPFTQTPEEDEESRATFGSIFDLHPTSVKKLYVVDSGLTFNSPFPVVLRPQREVDIILSFDFSARPTDDTPPFKELLLAAKWAELNKVPFPPVDPSVVEKEGLKECYVFRHPWDPNCPIVIHFPLVNINFKREIEPGVPRTTQEEIDFGNFSLFDDPKRPYSTFKFTYTHIEFERISKLMEYNTLLCQDAIFDNISVCIKRRRKFSIRRPCRSKDIARLSLSSRVKIEKLQQYIEMAEKVAKEAEQEEKKSKLLRRQLKVDKPRPVSSPVNVEEDQEKEEGESGNETVKNSKLQRSTVSLRPKMTRGLKPALSDVRENTEDKEDEEIQDQSSEKPKKPLTRSKPVKSRMMDKDRTSGLSPFSVIEEETSEANMGRRTSIDDSEVNYKMHFSSPPASTQIRLNLSSSAKPNVGKNLAENVQNSSGTNHINGNGKPECDGCGTPEEDFVDASSLQDWINNADKVTDL